MELTVMLILIMPIKVLSLIRIMHVQRERYFNLNVVYRENTPSMYDCVDLCVRITQCASLTYDTITSTCHIANITYEESPSVVKELKVDKNYVYIARDEIIYKDTDGKPCYEPICGMQEMCNRNGDDTHTCTAFSDCIDATVPVGYCTFYARIGGCDEANVGKKLTRRGKIYTYANWLTTHNSCRESCLLC